MAYSLVLYIFIFFLYTWIVSRASQKRAITIKLGKSNIAHFYPEVVFIVFLISVFYGIRGIEVGTDTINYLRAYETTYVNQMINGVQIAYNLLYGITKKVFDNYNITLFFVELLIISVSSKAILDANAEDRSIGCLCFAFLANILSPSFNIQKQICAVALVFLALIKLEKGKVREFCILVIIATCFHTAAIVSFVFLLIYYTVRSNSRFLRITMIAAIIAVFLLEPLVYERMIRISMFSQYGYYASSGGVTKYSVFLIYKLPIFAIILCFWKKLKLENMNYLYFISVICQVLAILLSYKTEWGFRLMYYFIPAEILLISRVPKAIRGNKRIVKWGICLYYLVYFVILTFFRGVDGIYPYITIWN